jgi:hypothetical protein
LFFTCSDPTATGSNMAAYCCASSGQDICAPYTPTTRLCPVGVTPYSCTGISRPDTSDPTLTCDAPTYNNRADAPTSYCCLKNPAAGTAQCAYASNVPGCHGWRFFPFSCTGSGSPEQIYPSLQCSLGIPGANAQTMYCCVSATLGSSVGDAGTDAAPE